MKWLLLALAVLVASCTSAVPAAPVVNGEPNEVVAVLTLSSPAFSEGEVIPQKFTCDGKDVNPELHISGVPAAANSLVLIVDDPDAPPKVWEHWTLINIPPTTTSIAENSVPEGAVQLTNDFKKVDWGGPCPPPGKVHNYNFKLYALDTMLDLPSTAAKLDVEAAMDGRIIEETALIGAYERLG